MTQSRTLDYKYNVEDRNFLLEKAHKAAHDLKPKEYVDPTKLYLTDRIWREKEYEHTEKKLSFAFRKSSREIYQERMDSLNKTQRWVDGVLIRSLDEYQHSDRTKSFQSFIEKNEKLLANEKTKKPAKELNPSNYKGEFLGIENSKDNKPLLLLQVGDNVKVLPISEKQANDLTETKRLSVLTVRSPEITGAGKNWHISSEIGKGKGL